MKHMVQIYIQHRKELKKNFEDEWQKQEKDHMDRVFHERE